MTDCFGEWREFAEMWQVGLEGEVYLAVQIDAVELAAMAYSMFVPGGFDQDSPHGFSGSGEEMAAVIPGLIVASRAEEAQISFVHQRRGLQRLPRLFLGNF